MGDDPLDPLDQLDAVDFAVAAFRVGEEWTVHELTLDHLEDADAVARALRRLPGDGAIAMVAVDEDWFLLVRVVDGRARLLLSDVTAAEEWELAASALDLLGLPDPEDDDEQEPAGELDLLDDLGVSGPTLAALVEDLDLYPDEILSEVARRAGFGPQFDDVVGLAPA